MICTHAQRDFLAWAADGTTPPPADLPALVAHLQVCPRCQRQLAAIADPPLAVRALTERRCATMLAELAACADLGPAAAAQRYPIVAWMHLTICPQCSEVFVADVDLDDLAAAPPARPPVLARLARAALAAARAANAPLVWAERRSGAPSVTTTIRVVPPRRGSDAWAVEVAVAGPTPLRTVQLICGAAPALACTLRVGRHVLAQIPQDPFGRFRDGEVRGIQPIAKGVGFRTEARGRTQQPWPDSHSPSCHALHPAQRAPQPGDRAQPPG